MQQRAEIKAPISSRRPRRGFGLSWKVLALTAVFVMVSEALIYLPSVSNYRLSWLGDRLSTASSAAIVLAAAGDMGVPQAIQSRLLSEVGADRIAIRDGAVSRLIVAQPAAPVPIVDTIADLRQPATMLSLLDAVESLLVGGDRTLLIIGHFGDGGSVELVLSDAELHKAMIAFSLNILWTSIIISVLVGALVFFALSRVLVRPMLRMSQNMVAFTEAPEDSSRVIHPSNRSDEIGIAESHLATMQKQLQATLQQQRRLADLGLAVSKINHDLRNMLASAQLLSDRIGSVPDPAVQRLAPKLISALDRAIAYAQSTLAYGKPKEPVPQRRLVRLVEIVREVAEMLSLDTHTGIAWDNRVSPKIEIDADPDQLSRVLVNLCRNAIESMEGTSEPAVIRRLTVEAERTGSVVSVRVRDTGPGVPEKARQHLFQPFQGSVRPGGTGLGLAISAELIRAHGGSIELVETGGRGSVFEITIPDRPLDFVQPNRVGGRR